VRDAGADLDRNRQVARHPQSFPQACEEREAGFRVGLDQAGRELVAAHPAGEVRPAQLAPQDPRNPSQCLVAGLVAVRVVDPLEVVEVEEDERQAVP
jgi:hypothetical protein